MSELELKFNVEPNQRAGLLKALGNQSLEHAALSARYFDTTDLRLARHGLSLRLRADGGRCVQTLKAATPGNLERFEDEVEVDPADCDGSTAVARPGRHADTKVGKRLLSLLGHQAQLVEVWRTEVARTRQQLHSHGADIEWALDEGSASAGGRSRPILELELEFKGGDVAGFYATARDWQERHTLSIDVVSKAERGAQLLRGLGAGAAVKAEPPDWSADDARAMDGSQMLRTMVAASLQQILPNASEVAHGDYDAEHVHQLRIGLRRLRAAARGMKPSAGELPPDWEAQVAPLFDALGHSRDAHVFETELAPRLRRAGAPAVEQDAAPHDDDPLPRLVRDAGFQRTLLALLAFVHDPDSAAEGAEDGSALDQVRKTLQKLWRRVLRDADRFDELPFEQQHRDRKRLKRLRYLAEFVAPCYEPDDVAAWLKHVKPAQEAMGAHIDLCQAASRLTDEAGSRPTAWFAVGWLRSQAEGSARDSRRALRRLARARPFWKRRLAR